MKILHTWQILIIAGLLAFAIYFFWWDKWTCHYKLWVAERLLKKLARTKNITPEQKQTHLDVAEAIKKIRKNIEDFENEDESNV